MRIVHVDTGREMRGGQWQAFYLAQRLNAAGHECVLLAPSGAPLFEHTLHEGIRALPLRMTSLMKWTAWADVVHAHSAGAHTWVALLTPQKLVVSRRVAFPVKRGWLSRWKYRRAAGYISVSEAVKKMLLAADVQENRIAVVYDGVPLLVQSGPSERVIAPRTDDPRKGSELVRQAARIAGVNVHFSEHLVEDLADAGLFVYVTEQEGLGSGALLAMSAGVAVVASRVGGLCEVVEDGVSGVLVENDAAALAEQIRRLSVDPDLRARMGKQGRERVQRMFSLDLMMAGTLDAYKRVMA